MNIIGWILFGLVVGAIAKFLMPGRDPGGWIVTILLGIAGSFVGGFYARATREGCDARISSHAREYFDYSLGTRCCRSLGGP